MAAIDPDTIKAPSLDPLPDPDSPLTQPHGYPNRENCKQGTEHGNHHAYEDDSRAVTCKRLGTQFPSLPPSKRTNGLISDGSKNGPRTRYDQYQVCSR
jgi:hypothetical protein